MKNPLNDPNKNPLKQFYEDFWVPIFGRMLNWFVPLIEGDIPKEKQTYNLKDHQDKKK